MTGAGGIEAFFARAIDRFGPRAPLLLWAVAWPIGLFATVATAVAGIGYLELCFTEFLRVTAVGCAVVTAGFVIAVWLSIPMLRPVIAWLRGGATAIAPARAWAEAVRLPQRLALRTAVVVSVLHLPLTDVYVARMADLSLPGYLGVALLVQIAVVATACLALFYMELAVRPIVKHIAPRLPRDFDMPRRRWRLEGRMLGSFVILAAATALFSVAALSGVEDIVTRVWLGSMLAVAIGVAFGAFYKVAIVNPTLRPLHDLREVVERVKAG